MLDEIRDHLEKMKQFTGEDVKDYRILTHRALEVEKLTTDFGDVEIVIDPICPPDKVYIVHRRYWRG